MAKEIINVNTDTIINPITELPITKNQNKRIVTLLADNSALLDERNKLFAENTQLLNNLEDVRNQALQINSMLAEKENQLTEVQRIHSELLHNFNKHHKHQSVIKCEGLLLQRGYADYALTILNQIKPC